MAIELVRHSDSRIDRQQLEAFLNSYQRVAPLTIGELWAWPSMLTLALVENLRRLADEMLALAPGAARSPTTILVQAETGPAAGMARRASTSRRSCSCCFARASTAHGAAPAARPSTRTSTRGR